jgi:hypothetical protein
MIFSREGANLCNGLNSAGIAYPKISQCEDWRFETGLMGQSRPFLDARRLKRALRPDAFGLKHRFLLPTVQGF